MTSILKKYEVLISEMETLLARWTRDSISKDLLINFKQTQKRVISHYEDIKSELGMQKG